MDFPRLVSFLAELAENNNKPWFEAHRDEYQALRDQFTDLVGELIGRISEFDDSVRWVDPKSCLFRIYRDVRFSREKTPYKTTFAASIGERGRKDDAPGYYFHVDEKGALLVAGGVYMPPTERLARIREYIADHPEKLQAVLRKKAFKAAFGDLWDERLKRPPRGYSEDTPMIGYIKLKHYIAETERDVSTEAAAKDVVPWMADNFQAMYPFLRWLRDAVKE